MLTWYAVVALDGVGSNQSEKCFNTTNIPLSDYRDKDPEYRLCVFPYRAVEMVSPGRYMGRPKLSSLPISLEQISYIWGATVKDAS